jgi:IstB-like ATP binding protein
MGSRPSGRSFGEVLAGLERRGDPRARGAAAAGGPGEPLPEPVRCELPAGHLCTSGWHLRPDGGAGTAYERCPRWQERRAAAAVREIAGLQTFATFDSRREPAAFTAARKWTESCRTSGAGQLALVRPPALETNTGCGKTHLLRAAVHEITRCGRWVEFATALDLTAVVRGRALYDSFDRGQAEAQAERWSRAEVLVLDDLGHEETTGPATASFLVGLLERRAGRALGFSSNLDETGLRTRYGAPLASRLLGGALAPLLHGRDYRQRGPAREPAEARA